MKVEQELWPQIAWMNSRQLADILSAGEQIKIIR